MSAATFDMSTRSGNASRRGALRSLVALLLAALALAGCATQGTLSESGTSELRAIARQRPTDPEAQRKLALAELFAYDGEPAHVDAQLTRALELNPSDERLWLAQGLQHDAHGRPGPALDAYLRALKLAARSTHPSAAHVSELAVHAIDGVDGGVTGYSERVRSELTLLLDEPRLATPARGELAALLMRLHQRRGDLDTVRALAARLGCVTQLRAAGPFGPRDLLGFDRDFGVRAGAPLAASYDLGPGRGVQATRELGARGCAVHAGGGPIAAGGTSYLQGYTEVAEAGDYLLRFESPNSAEVWLDGTSVLRIDRRTQAAGDTSFVPLRLTAGRHELLIKLSTRHPNPVVSIAVSPARALDDDAIRLPFEGDAEGFARYVRAATALGRGDAIAARVALRGVERAAHAAPFLLLQRASVMSSDPLMPSAQAQDGARRMLERAIERDPGLWNPTAQLAQMAANNGRAKEAIASLRQAVERWPAVPALRLALAELLQDQGWDAEAERVIADARELWPDACGPMAAELEALSNRQREHAAGKLVEELMACEAQSNARYARLLRARKWEQAGAELERLASFEAPQHQYGWTLARLELAKNRGDEAAVQRYLGELRAHFPTTSSALVEQLDRLAAAGKMHEALGSLQAAVTAQPAALSELLRLAPVLGGEHVLARYRKSGLDAIAAYEASGRSYPAPQVLVFDYMASHVFDDGSSVELVHTVQKAQSDEAINELAEVAVPQGARVLTLRVVKPDGRKLEADAIANKDTISLPSMALGDYVEMEYLLHREPPDAFPGGHSGERFFFQSFEIPFDHSEMIVELPASMPYVVDPRGPAPAVEDRVEGDLRVLRFLVEKSAPLQGEPLAVNAREYLPSVRVASRANWADFTESIREALIDRDLYDPDVEALVAKIVGDVPRSDPRARAKLLYDWVLTEVENNEDVFSQAAVMLRARTGNRARVLAYLLRLAGVPAKLALVRSATGDTTRSEVADGDTYEHLLVTFEDAKGPVWLFTAQRWAPFGLLPPQLAGQPALLLTPDAKGSLAATVPAADPNTEGRTLTLDVHVRRDGGARIDVVEEVRGMGAVGWREQLESVPSAELSHRFDQEYAGRLVPGARLTELDIGGLGQNDEAVRLAFSVEVASLGRRVAQGYALPPLLPSMLSASYARVATRTTTELVPSPQHTRIVLRVHAPEGGRLPIALPAPLTLEGAVPGRPRYTQASRIEDGVLIVERDVRLPIMRVTPRDYAAFAQFCRAVDAAEAQELVVRVP